MIKRLMLITAMLITIGGCSEMANEVQDVYLECHREGTDFKYPTWYSFDTDIKDYGKGYYWEPHNPMKREQLTNVRMSPTFIYFKQGIIDNATPTKNKRRLGRLENRQGVKPFGGSNPSLSATAPIKIKTYG